MAVAVGRPTRRGASACRRRRLGLGKGTWQARVEAHLRRAECVA